MTYEEHRAALLLLEELEAFLEWERLHSRELRHDVAALRAEYAASTEKRAERRQRLKRMRWAEARAA